MDSHQSEMVRITEDSEKISNNKPENGFCKTGIETLDEKLGGGHFPNPHWEPRSYLLSDR